VRRQTLPASADVASLPRDICGGWRRAPPVSRVVLRCRGDPQRFPRPRGRRPRATPLGLGAPRCGRGRGVTATPLPSPTLASRTWISLQFTFAFGTCAETTYAVLEGCPPTHHAKNGRKCEITISGYCSGIRWPAWNGLPRWGRLRLRPAGGEYVPELSDRPLRSLEREQRRVDLNGQIVRAVMVDVDPAAAPQPRPSHTAQNSSSRGRLYIQPRFWGGRAGARDRVHKSEPHIDS
jgi:hypothetical protein